MVRFHPATPKALKYVPRNPEGIAGSLRYMDVQLTKKASKAVKVAMTNSLKLMFVVESITVQITTWSGRIVTADATEVGDLIASTTCGKAQGIELHPRWDATCEIQFTSVVENGVTVKVDVRGTQAVVGGFHPVVGTAQQKL
jgi:hypothetical protein